MRKIVGPILIGLGAFLLVVAVLAVAYAPGEVKRTPLGVDSTTKLEGQADRLGAGTRPIYALSITKSDDNVSTDDVVVFTNIACAVFDEGQERACADGDDENALSLSTDVFATDRVTAEAVDVDALPDSAEPHEGLVNKWPFDAKQETYPYWDGVTGSAQDAVFEREDEVDGLDVYVYRIEISNAPIEIADGVNGHLHLRQGDLRRPADRRDHPPDRGAAALPRGRHPGPRPPDRLHRRAAGGERRRRRGQHRRPRPAHQDRAARGLHRRRPAPADRPLPGRHRPQERSTRRHRADLAQAPPA